MQDLSISSEIKISGNIYFGNFITDVIKYLDGYDGIFIVYDKAVCGFKEKLAACINKKLQRKGTSVLTSFNLNTGEEEKNIYNVLEICQWLLKNNANRNSLLLAIGGGITTDIAGFAGSIYKRGIRTAFIPTTVLAQTDAAIGGKNGVNFLEYKNILGTIRQPEFVFECPEVLTTLPYRNFVSGSGEIIKCFIINNEDSNYEKAVSLFSEIYKSSNRKIAILQRLKEISDLIKAAAKIKADVVNKDPFEKGLRRVLNLGHTFAHAIEWQANTINGLSEEPQKVVYEYCEGTGVMHGEAVAVGIILAAIISEQSGVLKDKRLVNKLIEDFISCGLPTGSPFKERDLIPALYKDKKAENGIIHFILIEEIGKVVEKDLTAEDATSMIEKYLQEQDDDLYQYTE